MDALEKAEADLDLLKKRPRPTKPALSRAERLVDRARSLLAKVDSRDFALVQKPFLWPIAFPDVLREGDPNSGFDIVLANLPYVRQENLDAEDQRSYGEAFPEVHSGMADLLVYFYARALQILRPSGWLSFITSNKFMRAGYGAAYVSIFRLRCASAASSTSGTCLCSRPTARLLQPTPPCW